MNAPPAGQHNLKCIKLCYQLSQNEFFFSYVASTGNIDSDVHRESEMDSDRKIKVSIYL